MPDTSPLNPTHLRILQWLRHYPFQRLDDLVVALLPWCGRTTIYTHLKDLERLQFVEALKAPMCPGTCLYHLSPVGLTWYLLQTQTEETVLSAEALREARAAERAALLRLLPRVPVLLMLQTAINGLVRGAAKTLTHQGQRARLVRWNWQRDVVYSFVSHGQPMRWFAESIGALCLRYAPSTEGVLEQWYRFFLLFTPLTHPRLMRARLDRLLRWRESKERWSAYTQMPPLLILAASERQAAWWCEAAERVTHDLGVAPPLGAIVPLLHGAQGNAGSTSHQIAPSPWQLPWRRLEDHRACHLREVFSPQHDPGFPDLFPQEMCSPLREGTVSPVQMPPIRLRLYQFAQRSGRGGQQTHGRQEQRPGPKSIDRGLRVGLDLSPSVLVLLVLLQGHPLLDRGNLCTHLHLERSSVRHLLAPLVQAQMIACYETEVGERFALAEGGLRLLAAAVHYPVRTLVHRPKTMDTPDSDVDSSLPLVPRGLPGLLKQVTHLAGIYGFFDAVAALGGLRWWETGTICARFYQDQAEWHGIRPDAVAECDAGAFPADRPWRFWLEWDRGTMRERDLQRKMDVYARYFTSREWAREQQTPPTLLYVLPDAGQERLLTRIALAELARCPTHVPFYTTTRGLLATRGLAEAIWRQVLPQVARTADVPVLRRLFNHIPAEAMSRAKRKQGERA